MKTIIHFMMLMAVLSYTAKAQELKGSLVDEKKAPLEFANIVLMSNDSSYLDGTVSGLDGKFAFTNRQETDYILKVSSIGYKTKYVNCKAGDLGIIAVEPDVITLKKVVVVGNLPTYQMRNGGITTHIKGSVLSKSGTANDLLGLLPGVQGEDGEYTVLGKGTPIIYIDGRQIRESSELDKLSSSKVLHIEVIFNPGAKYDATVNAIIKIKTVREPGEGIGVDMRSVVERSYKTNLIEQVNLNYRKNNLDLFGDLQYSTNDLRQESDIFQRVYTQSNVVSQDNNMMNDTKMKLLNGEMGMNYIINKHNSFGVSYNVKGNIRKESDIMVASIVRMNDTFYDKWENNIHKENHADPMHHINGYFNGKIKKMGVDLNMDYVYSAVDIDNIAKEVSQEFEDQMINSVNKTTNSLFATKLVLNHPVLKGNLSWGGEYTNIKREDYFNNIEEILPFANNTIYEDKIAGFVQFDKKIGKVQSSVGLRYEYASFDYHKDDVLLDQESKEYHNLFPSISLAFPIKKIKTQFSYSAKTKRPTFSQLRSNLEYVNRYTYQSGNPLLKPSITHDITLMMMYKWIHLNLSYQSVNNPIIYTARQYQENPEITLVTYDNFNKINLMTAVVTLAPKIGIWNPQLTLGAYKQWFEVDYFGEKKKMTSPQFVASFNNSFKLPKDFIFRLDANFKSEADVQNLTTGNMYMINTSINKSLLSNRLNVNLQVFDIFNSLETETTLFATKMDLNQKTKTNSQKVRLTLRYNFNITKNKYKGKGAGVEDIKRL
ncbi:MAG: TonB-dependent receptor [Tannerellaceae bacterium]|jgi:hypothetical protein|nr:TonB-dependent receptor [Tannerellaceae bacterium]